MRMSGSYQFEYRDVPRETSGDARTIRVTVRQEPGVAKLDYILKDIREHDPNT